MVITLEHIGKRYGNSWIFRGLEGEFHPGDCLGVLGSNGSGKSTFLSLLSGFLTPSEGRITWTAGKILGPDEVHRYVSWASPAQSLYEEFTLGEAVRFHTSFKPFRPGMDERRFVDSIALEEYRNMPLRQFSSGMKQRVKLGLAICSDTPLLLLDEPASHLDDSWTAWYASFLREHLSNRLVFVASNRVEAETTNCKRFLEIAGRAAQRST